MRELNPPFRREGPVSLADRRTGHVFQCVGQELNLHSLWRRSYSPLGSPLPSRRMFPSGAGGSRTRSHQGLSLAALPICVPRHASYSALPDGLLFVSAAFPGVSISALDGIWTRNLLRDRQASTPGCSTRAGFLLWLRWESNPQHPWF